MHFPRGNFAIYLSYRTYHMYVYIYIYTVQGQRGPKQGFPTLRCDAPGGGWRCDAATLRGAGGAATLRRCDAAVGPVTLRRCWRCDAATLEWRCDAVGAATLRRGSDAATLLALRDAATLLALRRFLLQECTRRCVAARHGNPHWRRQWM